MPAVRALGLDLGERRIGVAISDSGGVLALPLCTIERSRDEAADHRQIERLVTERGVKVVVVGLPLSLSGRAGPAAATVKSESLSLRARLAPSGVDVVTHDERLSTAEADRALSSAGKSARSRRKVVDETAATVILQSWLATRRPEGTRARG
ncbi:MAG: Holliday junction resolvase RuvX [Acidimicrobiales bacterium]